MDNDISNDQRQTEEAFGFKWKRRDTYESPAVQAEWRRWLFEKYFDGDEQRLARLLDEGGTRKKILDAGCGSGGSGYLLFGNHLRQHDYLGVDISEAAAIARERFDERGIPGRFLQSDLNSIPEELGFFDIIFSEGVLHHTDSVASAIAALAERLKPGGHFLFYVYVKKAPIREHTDDAIRKYLSNLNNEQAWDALIPLTRLGKALGDLNVEIDVPEDIPFLGINKGRHNLQRFFYYKICKAYYRPDYTLNEMNHINFDWFRPFNCHRHTPDEVKGFCESARLNVERMHVEESGVTIIARK